MCGRASCPHLLQLWLRHVWFTPKDSLHSYSTYEVDFIRLKAQRCLFFLEGAFSLPDTSVWSSVGSDWTRPSPAGSCKSKATDILPGQKTSASPLLDNRASKMLNRWDHSGSTAAAAVLAVRDENWQPASDTCPGGRGEASDGRSLSSPLIASAVTDGSADLGVGGVGAGVRIRRVLSQAMTTRGGRRHFTASFRAIKPPPEGSLWPIKLTEGDFFFYDLLILIFGSVLQAPGNISSLLVRSWKSYSSLSSGGPRRRTSSRQNGRICRQLASTEMHFNMQHIRATN